MNLRYLFARAAASLVVFSFLTNANGLGGTPVWTQLGPGGASPAARSFYSAVYVPADNQMVVFEGGTNTSVFNDTWAFANANGLGTPAWERLTPSEIAPASRGSSSTVYDSLLNRMIIYGGGSGVTTYTDVWALQLTGDQAAASTTTLLTSSMNPQRINQPVTLVARVANQQGSAITGSVVFKVGVLVLGTVPLSGNQATLTRTFAMSGAITAQYSGDANNLASTSAPFTQTIVSRFTSDVAVSASATTVSYRDYLSLVVRVSGPTTATGSMLFYNGTTLLGAATLDANGVAILTRNTLPVGVAAISAKYVGSATLMPSVGNVTVTINPAPSTVQVVSSLNPANAGDLMDLVATINSTTGLLATGTVTFSQNGDALGPPVAVSGGRAVFATNMLATGTNTLDVSYSGSLTIAPSTTQYTQQIN